MSEKKIQVVSPYIDPSYDVTTIVNWSAEEKCTKFGLLTRILEDGDTNVRRKALETLKVLCVNYKPSGHQLGQFIAQCEHKLKPVLDEMVNEGPDLWPDMWKFIVNLLGAELHNAKSLLNCYLGILEKAMKRKDSASIAVAYKCWMTLIDNFSLDPDILSATRRVGLLLIPLNSKLAKEPDTLQAKFFTWWHLIVKLELKMKQHCESVLKSFLQYCFGPFGNDETLKTLKLAFRVPQLLSPLLKSLAVILSTGIPSKEHKVQVQQQDDLELPTVPIISNFEVFIQISDLIINAVSDIIHFFPNNEYSILSFEALAYRILELKTNGESNFQSAAGRLLQLVSEVSILSQQEDKTVPQNLLEKLVGIIFSTWDKSLLNTHINSVAATPHRFLLKLLLNQVPFMLSKGSEKYEERFVNLLRKLMENMEVMIAGPETLSDLTEIVKTFENISQLQSLMKEKVIFIKALNLWDHFSKILPKILPSESATEDCNALSKDLLVRLMLLPLRTMIQYEVSFNVEKLISNWKLILQKYVEISALSLSLKKRHPITEVSEQILDMLKEETYTHSAIAALTFVSSQMVAIRNSALNPSNQQVSETPSEVNLLDKTATVLATLTIAPANSKRFKKVISCLAKTLQSLMITQTDVQCLIAISKVFFTLLKIETPFLNIEDENLAEMWQLFANHFTKTLQKQSPGGSSREIKQWLKELLPDVDALKRHPNIKIQQGALALRDALNFGINMSNQRAATSVKNTKGDEQKPVSPRTFASPVSFPLATKRGRKSLLNPTVASPTVSSKSKPVLEDQDSQDFVKIAPKQKSKAVLTPHQRESRRRRRDDIPALYQGLSQDTFNSDTQDTQDAPMDTHPPLLSTSSKFIPHSEDANDIHIDPAPNSKLPDSSQNSRVCESQSQQLNLSEVLRPILEPIQVESKTNKKGQEIQTDDVTIIEIDIPNQAVASKKNDGPVINSLEKTSKENIRDTEFSLKESGTPVKVPTTTIASVETSSKDVSDDDIVILKETRSPSKNKDIHVNPASSGEEAAEDTQDVDFVENSQAEVVPDKTPTPNVVELQVSETKKTFVRVKNRQGVLLPTRSSKVGNKEKTTTFQPRYSNGSRGAQLLGLVALNQPSNVTEPKSSTPLPEIDPNLPATSQRVFEAEVIETTIVIQNTTDLATDSNISGEPEPALEMEVEEVPIQEREPTPSISNSFTAADENSPEKSISLVYASPSSANKRSNMKRSLESDDAQTPSPKKSKRVSFAEPVVSGQRESPKILSDDDTFRSLYQNFSPKHSAKKKLLKEMKASRKLSLVGRIARRGGIRCTTEVITVTESVTSQGSLPAEVPSDIPVYPPLIHCNAPVELIAPKLSSPMLVPALIEKLKNANILTIGNLSSLKEIFINSLEIKEPKIETLKLALTEFGMESLNEETETSDAIPLPDEDDEILEDMTTDEPQPLSIPIVEEPEDASENSLEKQLQELVKQHSLESVLQALRPKGDAPKIANVEMNLDDMKKREDRQKLVCDVGSALSPDEVMQVVAFQKRNNSKNVPIVKVLKSVGRKNDILDHIVQQVEPLKLINRVLQSRASSLDLINTVKEITKNMKTSDLLSALGRKEEVLDHVISSSDPEAVVAKILNNSSLPQLLTAIGQFDKLTDYIVSHSNSNDFMRKVIKSASTSVVLDMVGRQEEVLEYSLKNNSRIHVLKQVTGQHSAAQVIEAVGKEDDILEHLAAKHPKKMMKQLLDKAAASVEVLDAVIQMSDPVTLIANSAKILKDGDMKTIVENLEERQLDEVCTAIPIPILQNYIHDNSETANLLLSSLSSAELVTEFKDRCLKNKLTPEDLSDDGFTEIIFPLLPRDAKIECLKTDMENGERFGEVKHIILQNESWTELLKYAIDHCNAQKLTLEENTLNEGESQQLHGICKLLPVSIISKRLEEIASDATEETKSVLLKMVSSKSLLQLLSETDMETKEVICTSMIEGLPINKMLELVGSKLANDKITRKIMNVLQTWYTTYLPHMNVLSVLKAKTLSKEVRLEALEYLINFSSVKEIMLLLPMKDVIQHYADLISMPEYTKHLLKTSFEVVSVDDVVRFLGAKKTVEAIKYDLCSKKPQLSESQILDLMSSNSLVSHLSKLTDTEETLAQLKIHFPLPILRKLLLTYLI